MTLGEKIAELTRDGWRVDFTKAMPHEWPAIGKFPAMQIQVISPGPSDRWWKQVAVTFECLVGCAIGPDQLLIEELDRLIHSKPPRKPAPLDRNECHE